MTFGRIFLVVLLGGILVGSRARPTARHLSAEVARNERLTALAGAVLVALLVVVDVTVLDVQRWLSAHVLVGILLIPPVGLKLATTGERFLRYYGGDAMYRRAGPPPPLQRWTAPLLVLSTIALFATGTELWLFGSQFGEAWAPAHKLSFVIWSVLVAVHLAGHARRSAEVAVDALRVRAPETAEQRSLVLGSVLLGAMLAAASLLYATPFQFPGGE